MGQHIPAMIYRSWSTSHTVKIRWYEGLVITFFLLLLCFVFLAIDKPESSHPIVNFHTLVIMSGSPIKVQCDNIKGWDFGEAMSHKGAAFTNGISVLTELVLQRLLEASAVCVDSKVMWSRAPPTSHWAPRHLDFLTSRTVSSEFLLFLHYQAHGAVYLFVDGTPEGLRQGPSLSEGWEINWKDDMLLTWVRGVLFKCNLIANCWYPHPASFFLPEVL